MKLPPTPNQRIATALRQVTPAHAGGRTNLVAPTPTMPAPGTTATTGGLPPDWSIADADTVTSSSDMRFTGKVRAVDPLDAGSFILIDPTFSAPFLDGKASTGEEFQLVASPAQADFELNIATGSASLYTGAVGGPTTSFARVGSPAGTAELMATDTLVYMRLSETVDPGAPPTGEFRLFAKDNGSGKMQLCVRFPTGATQVLATEP